MMTDGERDALIAYRGVVTFARDKDGIQRHKPRESRPYDKPGPAKAFVTKQRKKSKSIKDGWVEILAPVGML
jgi:hypothetical protein